MMEFCLPDLGEGIVEAELVQWMIAPGDSLAAGQTIAEVMTDKATVDLPSPFAGVVTELLAAPGQHVKVGQPLIRYETSSSPVQPAVPADRTSGGESPSGPPSPAGPGRTTDESASELAHPTAAAAGRPMTARTNIGRAALTPVAAPSVRRMARQLGIDLSTVQGSGPNQRILIDDLASAANRTAVTASTTTPGLDTKPDQAMPQPGSRMPLQGLRRMIAERMVQVQQTIPDYSYIDDCDVTDLVRMRDSLKQPFAERGVRLTYLPFFVKAITAALAEVPMVNASIDTSAAEIVLHDRYHIGIATETASGLVVPVIRDADQKDLFQIAQEIGELSQAARNGKATAEQLRGSTFTITSVGNIGGLISTPILNVPEVGIMGIGRISRQPRFDEAGNVRAADIVYLSFTFDHRVVDGAIGARFGNAVTRRLTQPATLLVD